MTTATHRVPRLAPPRYTQPLQPTRRVRITIDGDARTLAHNPDLLRVGYGAHSSVMVNAAELGVTVEDVPGQVAEAGADTCTHPTARGVDGTPLDDPAKVWRCVRCGLRWAAGA